LSAWLGGDTLATSTHQRSQHQSSTPVSVLFAGFTAKFSSRPLTVKFFFCGRCESFKINGITANALCVKAQLEPQCKDFPVLANLSTGATAFQAILELRYLSLFEY
jgi:hypothetical protein